VPPLLVERTGFAPWISVFRYSLDTILECGSLLPLFRHPQVFLNRAGVILSEARFLRSEGVYGAKDLNCSCLGWKADWLEIGAGWNWG